MNQNMFAQKNIPKQEIVKQCQVKLIILGPSKDDLLHKFIIF